MFEEWLRVLAVTLRKLETLCKIIKRKKNLFIDIRINIPVIKKRYYVCR